MSVDRLELKRHSEAKEGSAKEAAGHAVQFLPEGEIPQEYDLQYATSGRVRGILYPSVSVPGQQ